MVNSKSERIVDAAIRFLAVLLHDGHDEVQQTILEFIMGSQQEELFFKIKDRLDYSMMNIKEVRIIENANKKEAARREKKGGEKTEEVPKEKTTMETKETKEGEKAIPKEKVMLGPLRSNNKEAKENVEIKFSDDLSDFPCPFSNCYRLSFSHFNLLFTTDCLKLPFLSLLSFRDVVKITTQNFATIFGINLKIWNQSISSRNWWIISKSFL